MPKTKCTVEKPSLHERFAGREKLKICYLNLYKDVLHFHRALSHPYHTISNIHQKLLEMLWPQTVLLPMKWGETGNMALPHRVPSVLLVR